jgi:hypothetical protein
VSSHDDGEEGGRRGGGALEKSCSFSPFHGTPFLPVLQTTSALTWSDLDSRPLSFGALPAHTSADYPSLPTRFLTECDNLSSQSPKAFWLNSLITSLVREDITAKVLVLAGSTEMVNSVCGTLNLDLTSYSVEIAGTPPSAPSSSRRGRGLSGGGHRGEGEAEGVVIRSGVSACCIRSEEEEEEEEGVSRKYAINERVLVRDISPSGLADKGYVRGRIVAVDYDPDNEGGEEVPLLDGPRERLRHVQVDHSIAVQVLMRPDLPLA